jgi:hypothetical protein
MILISSEFKVRSLPQLYSLNPHHSETTFLNHLRCSDWYPRQPEIATAHFPVKPNYEKKTNESLVTFCKINNALAQTYNYAHNEERTLRLVFALQDASQTGGPDRDTSNS